MRHTKLYTSPMPPKFMQGLLRLITQARVERHAAVRAVVMVSTDTDDGRRTGEGIMSKIASGWIKGIQ